MSIKIYGKQWGEYPSDSELGGEYPSDSELGGEYPSDSELGDSCNKEVNVEVSVDSIVEFCINDIMDIVVEEVTNRPSVDYYTEKYGVIPRDWIYEGEVIGIIYDSNSEETRKLWGTSLTISFLDSDDEGDPLDDYDDSYNNW